MVLGLTPHDLRQAAAALAGSPVSEVRVSAVSERAGLNSATSSAVVTVELASQVVQLFVKSNAVLHRHEAARYRALAGTGVPAPRLLLAVDHPPVEVIVLEALDRIGIDPSSPTEVLESLRLCARLNACWGMPWMLRQHDAAPGSVPLAETIRCMHEDLPAIGG